MNRAVISAVKDDEDTDAGTYPKFASDRRYDKVVQHLIQSFLVVVCCLLKPLSDVLPIVQCDADLRKFEWHQHDVEQGTVR